MQKRDPKYVGFLSDVAHYLQGGGDPAAAVRKYNKRIKMLYIKDVKNVEEKNDYQFVEFGQGRVNFPAIFDALNKINYNGYAVVKLDAVPVKDRTPLESAKMAKGFLNKEMKLTV